MNVYSRFCYITGTQRSQIWDTSTFHHWFPIQPSRILIQWWGQNFSLSTKKSPPFVLIAKLLFQTCHRNKGNLVLFHYLTNKICAPVILVLLLTNVLPTIKLWLYKKIRCQFIHWINQGYIGVVLHMPGCFPIQTFFFCTDLWKISHKKSYFQSRYSTWEEKNILLYPSRTITW